MAILERELFFPTAQNAAAFLGKVDLHSHSTFVDGKQSVTEMIEQAEACGISYYALTEHVRTSANKWWKDYVAEIKQARQNKKVKVLIGMEANAIGAPGNVDVTESMWRDAEIVLGSVHGYYDDDTWEKIPDGKLPRQKALDYEVQKTIGLAQNEKIDVLAHPGYIFERHYGDFPMEALQDIALAAKKNNTAVEITYPFMAKPDEYAKVLMEINPLVSIGSNAHTKEHIGCLKDVLAGIYAHG